MTGLMPSTEYWLNNTMKHQLQELANTIKDTIPQDIVMHCRAVSVCSVFIEKEICESNYEELTDGLVERFGNMVDRELVDQNVFEAVQYGIQADLMEIEEDSITLTLDGILAGEEWLEQVSAV